MNSLERTLIEKAGYDNGWEITVESNPEQVILASALHRARARVSKSNGKIKDTHVFAPSPNSELRRRPALKIKGHPFFKDLPAPD